MVILADVVLIGYTGVTELSLVDTKCFGEGGLWITCLCKGVQKESSGNCDWLLNPGENAVLCPLLLTTLSSRVALGDVVRPRMQRSGFFGGTGFSGEQSFLGLLGFKSLLQCLISTFFKSPSAAQSDCICDFFLSFCSTSSLLSNSIFLHSL